MIIAIDGTVASGKSTVAGKLAQKLDCLYINTGLMYRAVAAFARINKIDTCQKELVTKLVQDIKIDLVGGQGQQRVLLNGLDLTAEATAPDIGKYVSDVADNETVRQILVKEQQRLGAQADRAVLEGRDIGSVVFPQAEFKFFVTAETRARALRRLQDDRKKKADITLEEVEKQLIDRDRRDRERPVGALIQTADSILIDTTNDRPDEVVNKMIKYIKDKNE